MAAKQTAAKGFVISAWCFGGEGKEKRVQDSDRHEPMDYFLLRCTLIFTSGVPPAVAVSPGSP